MTTLDVGIAALRSSLSALRLAASRGYEFYDRTSATLKAVMPKGLYARALLIIIAPMVVLQSVVAFMFMERHYNLVTQRLSAGVVQDIATLIEIDKAFPQEQALVRRAEGDDDRDGEAHHRVDPLLAGPQDDDAGENHGRGNERVRRHVLEGRVHVDVVRSSTGEQQGGGQVHDNRDCDHPDHRGRFCRCRVEQPPDRFGRDRADCHQQQQGIDQRGQD